MYSEALLPGLPAALSLMALLTRQRLLMGFLVRWPCDHCGVCRAGDLLSPTGSGRADLLQFPNEQGGSPSPVSRL